MFPSHYKQWNNSRLNGIKKYIGTDIFKNIEVLDLGTGDGFFGQWCNSVGSNVTCVDIRKEYLDMIKKKNSKIRTMSIDCDGPINIGQFDLIIHFSLLQHISNVDQHLKSLKNKCKYMLLESEVLNTDQKLINKITEKGPDLSFYGTGSRCSASYIEEILDQIGFKYKRLDDSILNSDFHCYDWKVNKIDGLIKCGYRRFWICWITSSPIKTISKNCTVNNTLYNYVDTSFAEILEYTNGSVWKCNQYGNNIDYYFGGYRSDLQLIKPNGMVIIDRYNQVEKQVRMWDLYILETVYSFEKCRYLFFRKKGVQPKYNDVTIVIQGGDTPTTIISICLAFINANIVISTWNQYNFSKIEQIVKNFGYHNRSNIYYQIYTTLEGLKKVKSTKFTIKIRSDEIYSNYDYLAKLMVKQPEHLITGNQFIRPNWKYPYHISDHLIGGKTENLLIMFSNAKQLIESRKVHHLFFDKYRQVPEQVLTVSYLLGLNPYHKFSPLDTVRDMNSHFISIPPDKMGFYQLSAFKKHFKHPNGHKLVDLLSYECLE